MRPVSQLNAAGYFVCQTAADPSPMEEGVWLLPGGAVDAPPPTVPVGFRAKWQDGAFVFEEMPKDAPPPEMPPPPSVPQVVSPFQAHAVLLQAGLLDDIEAYMADPATDPIEKLAWSTATEFRRSSPTVLKLKALLGLTDEQLDDLFRFAATIYA